MVVLDGGTGAERRQLAQIGVGVGVGSSTATVSADHRVVLTSWTSREPGCFFHVGVAPFDGSGTLVEWGRGINPSFSPDGRLVAWREASDGDCAQQALVVRDVTSGVEQRIVLTVAGQGFVTTGGPWWRDNDTIVFQDIGQDAARAGGLLEFDLRTAHTRADGRPVVVPCLGDVSEMGSAWQVPGRADPITSRPAGGGATTLTVCPLDGSTPRPIATVSASPVYLFADTSEGSALVVDTTGTLSIASASNELRRVAANVQAAAW